jgi:hypothetical protein
MDKQLIRINSLIHTLKRLVSQQLGSDLQRIPIIRKTIALTANMVRGMTAARSWYSFFLYCIVSTIAGFKSVQRALIPTLLQVPRVSRIQLIKVKFVLGSNSQRDLIRCNDKNGQTGNYATRSRPPNLPSHRLSPQSHWNNASTPPHPRLLQIHCTFLCRRSYHP